MPGSSQYTISLDDLLNAAKFSCQIPDFIEESVKRSIISKKAEECGIDIKANELQQAADNFRQEHDLLSAKSTLSWLQRHHMSAEDFEDFIKGKVLEEKLAQHLFFDKVEPYFVEHQVNYTQVVMYEVILHEWDLAMELFYALQENEVSFWDIAHQHIQDLELRRTGGYCGIQYRTDLKPEISAPVFASNPPEILKPILVEKKVHLILVEELIHAHLDKMLHQQILDTLFSTWLHQQYQAADIIWENEIWLHNSSHC